MRVGALVLLLVGASAFAPSRVARRTAVLRVQTIEQDLTDDGHFAEASGFSKDEANYSAKVVSHALSDADLQQCLQTGECELPGMEDLPDIASKKRGFLSRVFSRARP